MPFGQSVEERDSFKRGMYLCGSQHRGMMILLHQNKKGRETGEKISRWIEILSPRTHLVFDDFITGE